MKLSCYDTGCNRNLRECNYLSDLSYHITCEYSCHVISLLYPESNLQCLATCDYYHIMSFHYYFFHLTCYVTLNVVNAMSSQVNPTYVLYLICHVMPDVKIVLSFYYCVLHLIFHVMRPVINAVSSHLSVMSCIWFSILHRIIVMLCHLIIMSCIWLAMSCCM